MGRLIAATDTQLTEVLGESIESWGYGFTLVGYISYHQELRGHPWCRENFRHLVFVDEAGRVLSSCKLYHMRGWLRDREVNIAEIGAVYTPAACRGRGHATAMLEMLLERLREQGFDLAMLFSDIPPGFYSRLGFRGIDKRDLVFDLLPPASPQGKVIEVREKVPECVMSLYRGANFSSFRIKRDPLYWDMQMYKRGLYNRYQTLGETSEELHLREDGAAYAWTMWNGRSLQIKDAGYTSPSALADIFSALYQKHGRNVLYEAFGWLPPGFEKLPFLRRARRFTRHMSQLMFADLNGKNQDLFQVHPKDIQVWSLDYF